MIALRWIRVCVATAVPTALAAQAAAGPAGQNGPVEFSGLIDGYYSLNLNHPAGGGNQLRNFDVKANQFSLNMGKVTLERGADPAGFRVDLGFGRAFDLIHAGEEDPALLRHLEQAFLSWKPARGKGLQLDFGKFVTWAGAEVIETHNNWNYSRSLLFALAVPYYHFGLRASAPLTHHFSGGLQLVNGWNNVEDNNSGKTVGLTGSFTSPTVTWTNTYYLGPEKTESNQGYRHLYDTTLLVAPHPKANFYVNFDYGVDRRTSGGSDRWVGVAGAARFQVNSLFALSPRLEWFNDADGFSTGVPQRLKEFTMTGELKMREGLLARLEYRRDWSDQPFFNRGNQTGNHKSQDTLLLGLVAHLGPQR